MAVEERSNRRRKYQAAWPVFPGTTQNMCSTVTEMWSAIMEYIRNYSGCVDFL